MMIGRPLEFDPEKALECAMRLFWRKGYEATSLQDLLKTMGLSKSSFYQAFGSKHQLFERCIKHYSDALVHDMSRLLEKAASGRQFIEQLFRGVSQETQGSNARRGCLVMNSANEFAQRDPVVAELVAKSKDAFVAVFEKALINAQQTGDIPDDSDTRALANYLLSSLSGLKTMVKAGASTTTVAQIADVALTALD